MFGIVCGTMLSSLGCHYLGHINLTKSAIFSPRNTTSAYSSLHLDNLAFLSTTCWSAMLRLSSRCAKKRNCFRSFSSVVTTGVEVGAGEVVRSEEHTSELQSLR